MLRFGMGKPATMTSINNAERNIKEVNTMKDKMEITVCINLPCVCNVPIAYTRVCDYV